MQSQQVKGSPKYPFFKKQGNKPLRSGSADISGNHNPGELANEQQIPGGIAGKDLFQAGEKKQIYKKKPDGKNPSQFV